MRYIAVLFLVFVSLQADKYDALMERQIEFNEVEKLVRDFKYDDISKFRTFYTRDFNRKRRVFEEKLKTKAGNFNFSTMKAYKSYSKGKKRFIFEFNRDERNGEWYLSDIFPKKQTALGRYEAFRQFTSLDNEFDKLDEFFNWAIRDLKKEDIDGSGSRTFIQLENIVLYSSKSGIDDTYYIRFYHQNNGIKNGWLIDGFGKMSDLDPKKFSNKVILISEKDLGIKKSSYKSPRYEKPAEKSDRTVSTSKSQNRHANSSHSSNKSEIRVKNCSEQIWIGGKSVLEFEIETTNDKMFYIRHSNNILSFVKVSKIDIERECNIYMTQKREQLYIKQKHVLSIIDRYASQTNFQQTPVYPQSGTKAVIVKAQ
jgi:hypothetical protein